jgi:hypothetical protein
MACEKHLTMANAVNSVLADFFTGLFDMVGSADQMGEWLFKVFC